MLKYHVPSFRPMPNLSLYLVYVKADTVRPSSFNGCRQDMNLTGIDSSCEHTLNGVTIRGVPIEIPTGKHTVTELMSLLSVTDVNGRPVAYQASFSSDCNSTIQDLQVMTCTITNTAVE
jgi:hypothetical protein